MLELTRTLNDAAHSESIAETANVYSTLPYIATWILLSILLVAVAVLSLMVLGLFRRLAARESAALVRESRMRMLQGRLETQEALLLNMAKMQQNPDATSTTRTFRVEDSAHRYRAAARLAGQGHTPEELVDRCGLSPDEAEIIVKLHHAEADEAYAPFPPSAGLGNGPSTHSAAPAGEGKLQ